MRLTKRIRNHIILNDEGNTYTEALEKLAEYEDAEEQGQLIKLPCKIGDKVYIIINHKIFEEKLVNTTIGYETEHYLFDELSDLFFTHKEAEEALEKMEGGCKQ